MNGPVVRLLKRRRITLDGPKQLPDVFAIFAVDVFGAARMLEIDQREAFALQDALTAALTKVEKP